MTFGSATWVEILELVQELTMMVRHYRVPPGPEELARVAADIRAGAADREGPMPIEVRRFLAEYEDGAESRG